MPTHNTRFHPHYQYTSQHNQSEINYSNQSSNTLFKNKQPVDYKVISTQHAVPELEHGADVSLRTAEMSHLINLGMAEQGFKGITSQSYTGIKEIVAEETQPNTPRVEKNSYADMLVHNIYIENLHSKQHLDRKHESHAGLVAHDQPHHYPGSLNLQP